MYWSWPSYMYNVLCPCGVYDNSEVFFSLDLYNIQTYNYIIILALYKALINSDNAL